MITHAMRKEIKHVSGQQDEVSRRQRAQEERIEARLNGMGAQLQQALQLLTASQPATALPLCPAATAQPLHTAQPMSTATLTPGHLITPGMPTPCAACAMSSRCVHVAHCSHEAEDKSALQSCIVDCREGVCCSNRCKCRRQCQRPWQHWGDAAVASAAAPHARGCPQDLWAHHSSQLWCST